MKLQLSFQSGKKKESREIKGSVKIWELDSDVYGDSFVESDERKPVAFQREFVIGSANIT